MDKNQSLSTAFPFPPYHYSYFTSENLELLKSKTTRGIQENKELRYLVPPTPPDSDEYTIFGRSFSLSNKKDVLNAKINEILLENQNENSAEILCKLIDRVLYEYVEFLGVTVDNPELVGPQLAQIQNTLSNISAMVNHCRYFQAKESLKRIMDSQIAETDETIHELKNSKTRHSEEIARVKKKGLCLANTILSAEAGTGAFFRVGSPSRAASQGLDIDICTKDHIGQLKKGWEALFKM